MSVDILECNEVVEGPFLNSIGEILAKTSPMFQKAVRTGPKKRNPQFQLQIEIKTAITKIEKEFAARGISLVGQFKAGAILPKLVEVLENKRARLLKKSVGYPFRAALLNSEIRDISAQLGPCHARSRESLAKLESDGTLNRPFEPSI